MRCSLRHRIVRAIRVSRALLQTLNGLFAEAGYVTTQAWLPEQDIAASRTLVLQVIAGRVDRLLYEEVRAPFQQFVPRMAAKTRDLRNASGPLDLLRRADHWAGALDDEIDRVTLLPPSTRLALARTLDEGDILSIDGIQDTIDSLNRVSSQRAKADLKPGSRPAIVGCYHQERSP